MNNVDEGAKHAVISVELLLLLLLFICLLLTVLKDISL